MPATPSPIQLTIRNPGAPDIELGSGDPKWSFLNDFRTTLLTTPRGHSVLTSMAHLADETGGAPSQALRREIHAYLTAYFPSVVQKPLAPGVYGQTVCGLEAMAQPVTEKKKKKMEITLAAGIFEAWADDISHSSEPHILGAILTVTLLHELVHVLRRVFCETWTPERLRGSRSATIAHLMDTTTQVPTLREVQRGESGWEWEASGGIGEMSVAFTAGAPGKWAQVIALGFVSKLAQGIEWVLKSDISTLASIIDLRLMTLRTTFTYGSLNTSDLPLNAGEVWRRIDRERELIPLSSVHSSDSMTTISPSPSRALAADCILVYPRPRPVEQARCSLQHLTGQPVEVEEPVCGTTAASSTTTTASPASTSSSSSSVFHLQNGLDAQKLNAEFQSLTANSSCTPGQEACVGTSFAQCVSGSFTLTQCAAGTICAALPLVNKAGTSIGCDTSSDIAARIAATGATGGLTGSDSSSASSSSSADSGSGDGDDEDSGDCDADGDDDDDDDDTAAPSASGTPSSTIVFTSPSATPSATASDSDCDSDDDSAASSSQSPSSTIILSVPSSYSTVVASSSACAATSSAPAPSSSATTLLAQHGMAAQKLNANIKTLTAGAACTSGAQACIGDSFTQCAKGAYVLSPCSGGNICAAVPLADAKAKAGTSIGCDAPEDVRAKIAASGVAGGIAGA